MVCKHLGLLMLNGKKLFLVYPLSIKPLFLAQAYTVPMRQSLLDFLVPCWCVTSNSVWNSNKAGQKLAL